MTDQTAAGLAEQAIRQALEAGPTSAWLTHPRDDEKWRENEALARACGPEALRALLAQLEEQRAVSARMEADAGRYRLLRRKVAIAGGKFCILNLSPTYVAPDAGMELDAVLDIELKPMLERWGRLTKGDAAIDAAIASQQAGGKA